MLIAWLLERIKNNFDKMWEKCARQMLVRHCIGDRCESALKRRCGGWSIKASVGFTSLVQGQGHVIADAQLRPRTLLTTPFTVYNICLALTFKHQGRIAYFCALIIILPSPYLSWQFPPAYPMKMKISETKKNWILKLIKKKFKNLKKEILEE